MITVEWLAGFVEGEGTFSGSQRTANYFQPNFSLYQKDPVVLTSVQKFLLTHGIPSRLYTPAGTGCPTLSINKISDCQALYALLRPHMNAPVKIAQADKWITKFEYKGRNVKIA